MAEKDKDNDLVDKEAQIPSNIPVLPVRDIVVFPYMIIPLFVGREISIKAIEHALSSNRMILLLTQKDLSIENPVSSDLFNIGTVGMIIRMLKLPDGRVKVLVQGLSKAKVTHFTQSDPFIAADIEKIEEIKLPALNIEDEAQIRTVKEQLDKAVSYGKTILPDIMVVVENLDEPGRLADLVASNLGLKTEQAQEILEISDPVQRLKRISDILAREIELLIVQQKIQSEAGGEIDKTQREYYLREQLKAIQKELGDFDERAEEAKEFRKKIEEAKMPEKVFKEAEKQLKRLEKMHPDSAEAATIRTYLDWLFKLPWAQSPKNKLEIKTAQKDLNDLR